jgi:hypothetical protein
MRQLTWEEQVGTLCLYETKITPDCGECYKADETVNEDIAMSLGVDPWTAYIKYQTNDGFRKGWFEICLAKVADSREACKNCFFQTHYLQHVIDLVELGNKPVCEPVLGKRRRVVLGKVGQDGSRPNLGPNTWKVSYEVVE